MHKCIEPSILYFGTPVALISSLNEDGSTNISPMSSAWWLGWSCMLGLDGTSKTVENLRREKGCVINLAGDHNVGNVDKLALLTGSRSVPLHKKALGYRYSSDKFEDSGFTSMASELVKPKRISECPVHLEATVAKIHSFATTDSRMAIPACAVEVTIERIHVDGQILDAEHINRIDPDKWRPLIMSFRHFYGLTHRLQPSRLGKGAEERYAPWKQKGLSGLVTRVALSLVNRKYTAT